MNQAKRVGKKHLMKRTQATIRKDMIFEDFCREARYLENSQTYIVRVNGKLLRSDDTEDLFKQYQTERRNV